MYNPQLIKTLCISIALEKDAAESERLMDLLRAVMREDVEEVRSRLKLLKKLYDPILGAVANETIAKPEASSSAALDTSSATATPDSSSSPFDRIEPKS